MGGSLSLLGCLWLGAGFYLLVSSVLAARFARQRAAPAEPRESLHRFCQVKPVYRPDERTFQAVATFLGQAGVEEHDVYLCSAQSGPQAWLEAHPQVTWLRLAADQSQNGKAAILAEATRYWSGDIFVVSDADMVAPPGYLGRVLKEFDDPEVGVVTCLYLSTRPRWGDWGHVLESLCILDFASSVLVARRTEGVRFALGSTMAIRRECLRAIGGFEALRPYLADDYQLGFRAHQAGWKVRLAPTVLATEPPAVAWKEAFAHQFRWLVTSKVSRPAGHLAFLITQGLLWSILLTLWDPSLGAVAVLAWCCLRVVTGSWNYLQLGGEPQGLWQTLFLPCKDALFLCLWMASWRGREVVWGDRRLRLDAQGRIVP